MQQLRCRFLSIMTLKEKGIFLVTAVSYLSSIFLVSDDGVSSDGGTRDLDTQIVEQSSGKKIEEKFFFLSYILKMTRFHLNNTGLMTILKFSLKVT